MDPSEAPDYVCIATRWAIARKPHPCACCRTEIPIGTRHAVAVYKADGAFKTERMHGFGYPSCPVDLEAEAAHAAKDQAERDRLAGVTQENRRRMR